ncbi:LacI family DNA-binding transcriptional regulator [Paenibacillus hodogayensis]|uniref:LacI family DNA-binding transcriptional regulator n=1 Tax=Paenibacillus hodogayensis TaxID=279208 RepID=A0ABV5VRK2_9BACL
MITRKQVAEHAGVSVAAVSYVVNNKSGVGEATRQKVLEAIKELGYQPNFVARSLKTKKTNQLAVLVNYLGNSFEAGILLHLEARAREHGYYIVFQTYSPETEDEFVRFTAGRADGVVLLGQRLKPESLEQLDRLNLPVVSIMKPAGGESPVPYVDIDWTEAMRKLIGHLKEKGHTRIGFIGVDMPDHYLNVREDTFQQAMKEAGLPFLPEQTLKGDGRLESAFETMKLRLASPARNEYTAIAAASDLMAAGLLSAAREVGMQVPQELAVAGCENILMTSQTTPGITVIDYPRKQVAVQAIDLLVQHIDAPEEAAVALDADLIIRPSTCP